MNRYFDFESDVEKIDILSKTQKRVDDLIDKYKNLVNVIPKEELDFDLIWCDLGGLEHYLVYQDLLLPMIYVV